MFNFNGMFRAAEAEHRLDEILSTRKRAKDDGATRCLRCGYCCWTRPGALDKKDVGNIAKALKLKPEELFAQYLVVDEIEGRRVLLPRRHSQTDLAGRFVPDGRTYDYDTACVFLADDNLCKAHKCKPVSCRNHKCWATKNPILPEWTDDELEQLGWNGLTGDDDYWEDD